MMDEIPGIGKKLKESFEEKGITIRQLHNKNIYDKLPLVTQLYLKLKPLKRLPHDVLKRVVSNIEDVFGNIFIATGSFRRKKAFSKDLDLVFTKPITWILNKFKQNFNIEVYATGESRASFYMKTSKGWFTVDVFTVDKKDLAAMVLYSTGSKEFNVRMRVAYKHRNMLLNQYGAFLYTKSGLRKIPAKNETDYFDLIDWKYLDPIDRS